MATDEFRTAIFILPTEKPDDFATVHYECKPGTHSSSIVKITMLGNKRFPTVSQMQANSNLRDIPSEQTLRFMIRLERKLKQIFKQANEQDKLVKDTVRFYMNVPHINEHVCKKIETDRASEKKKPQPKSP